ncbi:TRAP transporter small permease [Microbacterium sp. Mu-80]|uniref:TRAP transporter small permease n=1 Tax=Microbacterium bandirmense TaxID=3122050 RepID=A0ABU8LF50_9MICO
MRIIRRITSIVEGTIPGLLLLFIVLMVTVDVFMRYVLSSPLTMTSEIAMVCSTWIIMLGSARAARKFQHITISALADRFHGRAANFHALIVTVVTLVILTVVLVSAVPYVMDTAGRIFPLTQIPRIWLTAAVPVGFALMIVHYVVDLVWIIRDVVKGGDSFLIERERQSEMTLDPTVPDTTTVRTVKL